MPLNKGWVCKFCEQGPSVLLLSTDHGDHLHHQRLCQGLDEAGHPLGIPTFCLVCNNTPETPRNAKTWIEHYRRKHNIVISDTQDLKSLRLQYQRHLFPDLDLNGSFGSFFSRNSPFTSSPDLRGFWEDYARAPVITAANLKTILQRYREKFWEIFVSVPISFYTHVSDIHPQVIGSTILQLIQNSENKALALSPIQRERCRIAVLSGTYGSTYGSQAYHSVISSNRSSACGHQPLAINPNQSEESLRREISGLANQGYIGITVEIVSADGGLVLPAETWNLLAEACCEAKLFLIVDEALTAVRCGAPFAFQRTEYARYRPSFILFGKGLRVGGLAVDPCGVTISELKYTRDELVDFCKSWADGLPSSVIPFPTLLEALGTLYRMQKEDWVARSGRIGSHFRQLIQSLQQGAVPFGLGGLIYLEKNTASNAGLYGAAAGPCYIRWIPYLDEGMDNYSKVQALFGPNSRSLREELQQFLSTPVCIQCGDYPEGGKVEFCKTCGGKVCTDCWDASPHKSGQCLNALSASSFSST